jgi:hypothetical protein
MSQVKSKKLNSNDGNIANLIAHLLAIDTKHSLAKLNATTIADNNGGRIEL